MREVTIARIILMLRIQLICLGVFSLGVSLCVIENPWAFYPLLVLPLSLAIAWALVGEKNVKR